MSRLTIILSMVILSLYTSFAQAAGGRADYDIDDDGLIEINDLSDLNEIRNNLDGASLYADSTGCPLTGCTGFELTAHLDFDSNGDGVLSIDDSYWNEGSGWLPIGSASQPFTATFDGSGFEIRNLMISNFRADYIGLFGYASNANLRNIALVGDLMSITGAEYVGGLVGYALSTNINACYVLGEVSSYRSYLGGLVGYSSASTINQSYFTGSVTSSANGSVYAGGLIGATYDNSIIESSYATGSVSTIRGGSYFGGLTGFLDNSTVIASFASGRIFIDNDDKDYQFLTLQRVGGLVGRANSGATIKASFSTGSVEGTSEVGGLVGIVYNSTVTGSYAVGNVTGRYSKGGLIGSSTTSTIDGYWAKDVANINSSGGVGVLFSELICPVAANDSVCSSSQLYTNWETFVDATGNQYWDFGAANELPGLVINGVTYRDTDGDAVPDNVDAFAFNSAAAIDQDGDGAVDRWNLYCDSACQLNSGLVLDQLPDNVAASIDADMDGLPDEWNTNCDVSCQSASGLTLDTFPDDADNDGILDTVDSDDNNDGIEDADANSNGLIEIASLDELNAIRNNLTGSSQILGGAVSDATGCPIRIVGGVNLQICSGYELVQNLDFDTSADGEISEADAYWNEGSGWQAIGGTGVESFSAVFEGNNFTISNLMINQPTLNRQGLFGRTNRATIQNLTIEGDLVSITGSSTVGILIGYSVNSKILNTHVSGDIKAMSMLGGLVGDGEAVDIALSSSNVNIIAEGDFTGGLAGRLDSYGNKSGSIVESYALININALGRSVGGLVGQLGRTSIAASFAAGEISSTGFYIGGLVGDVDSNPGIINFSFASVSLEGSSYIGGLVGDVTSNINITASYAVGQIKGLFRLGGLNATGRGGTFIDNYWATDISGQSLNSLGGTGVTLAELQCPVTADNADCAAAVSLYVAWDTYKDATGNSYWDFGSTTQLPGLLINGVIYRDSDGDNVLDSSDMFPGNIAASKDSDGDGAVDAWSGTCDITCQAASGLVLDQFPNSAAASIDLDLDGLPDAWNSSCDAACISASGLTLDTLLNDSDNDGVVNSLDDDDNNDGVVDVDADSNGLIEISSLEELDAIRNNLAGTGLMLDALGNSNSSGCPSRIINGLLQSACSGYELTQNLDFDTNSDGVLDITDTYWNDGQGWLPIGTSVDRFTGVFEGNGNIIYNLMINQSDNDTQAFIRYTNGATIRNLGLSGELMSVTGRYTAAGLIGSASDTNIEACFVTGKVESLEDRAAGLVYSLYKSSIKASFFAGQVNAIEYAGGLISFANDSTVESSFSVGQVSAKNQAGGLASAVYNSNIINSYSSSIVSGNLDTGGLIGLTLDTLPNVITNSYWAVDISGQPTSAGGTGFSSTELQCPTAADDTVCASSELYTAWANDLDAKGNAYWNFGATNQLPALVLNGVAYRDTDGDAVFDINDALPNNFAASKDIDGDGAIDQWTEGCDNTCQQDSMLIIDNFPENEAASVDTDLDGLPDAWNASCDNACQISSGLTLDLFANDFDNDGIADSIDDDDNNDGLVDADADSDGLIDIVSLDELNAMRYSLTGAHQKLTAESVADTSGCPVALVKGKYQRVCKGYELLQNIDFDSNADGVLDSADTYWNNGLGWEAIGAITQPFSAMFDGKGFAIYNLLINRPDEDYLGLWAYTNEATIQNLELSGDLMSIEGNNYVAGIVASATYTTINKLSISGSLSGNDKVGGLIATINFGSIIDSVVSGSMTLKRGGYVGGVVAIAKDIQMTGSRYIGGILSAPWPTRAIGGLIASAKDSVITASYSIGAISGSGNAGGLIGIGSSSTITGSFSTVNVSAEYDYAGGLIGDDSSSSITSSFASGNVSGRSSIGALIGRSSNGTVISSYAIGKVSGTGNSISGLLSSTSSVITDSYWATDTTQQSINNAGGVGALLTELQCPTSADNTDCASVELYTTWSSSLDANGNPYWNFGTDNQLPGLTIAGVVHRDSDGDSVLDANDAFPLDNTESVDTDNDGIGNNADTDDDNDGVEDTLDLFPLDASETTDFDGDGIGDTADTDDDNDGVLDINDPDNTVDNGKPIIESASTISLRATGDFTLLDLSGETFYRTIDYYDSYSDWNEVGETVLEASLNGEVLIPDVDNRISLPSGPVKLQWVAIDAAGNRSDPFEQLVKVYPLVGFETAQSITGEPSQARLNITFSGPSPEYPVVIDFSVTEQSATFDDLDSDFINQKSISIRIENEDELNNAALVVPVIDENMAEVDEVINVNINSARAGADEFFMPVYNSKTGGNFEHDLTITETNLPPAVTLEIYQDGSIVDVINSAGGEVEIIAVVVDPNGNDTTSVVWDLTEISASAANDAISFTFSPSALANGFYGITINVTDNGDTPLSVEETFVLVVEKKAATTGGSGGGGGGGSLSPLFLFLFLSLFAVRLKRKIIWAK